MPRPAGPPIGLKLAGTAKTVSKAFDQALASAGGSLPMWLVLLSVKTRQRANQRQLAAAIGIQGATLTHHLNAMEDDGLLTRRRDPTNRRVHVVELTALGETAFHRLRDAAMSFDQRLRTGLDAEQLSTLGSLLDQLASNVTVPGDDLAVPQGPGAGLGS
ncbi:MAG: hypothetical protein JWR88_1812 [Pseudonocardia sp.]|jgi:MarR family transcriptional regulator for hemolysin|nr:hypothetical protein [Pseudonocardia sp.]